ncbi:MAG TPA: Crp/Fnr family transcriptional regulator [Candidatus Acidoferrum sp.]|nr:Crp/Fnr family transcriptional regulator [Candidatus Acidoferrum sp.]
MTGSSSESATSIARLISEHRVFAGLAPQYLNLLADVAMLKKFETNEVLFRESDPANRFYLILDGEVTVESVNGDASVLVQTVGRDDVLGWSWLFPPYYWHFDARALRTTRAIFFYGTWLRENCERDHEFGYEMLTRFVPIMIERLQAARRQFVKVRNVST